MNKRRLTDQLYSITMNQRTVRIIRNPDGSHDVFLHSVMGVITCSRHIRKPASHHVNKDRSSFTWMRKQGHYV